MTDTYFQIRSAKPNDAAGIARVHVDAWRSAYAGILPTQYLVNMSVLRQERHWSDRLAAYGRQDVPFEQVFIAEDLAGEVIGFGSSGPNRDAYLNHPAEIYTLYVSPDVLSQGVGRALLRALYDNLLALGCQSSVIWALSLNPYRHFYSALGGEIIAERDSRFYDARLREVAYGWKDLEAWRKAQAVRGKALH